MLATKHAVSVVAKIDPLPAIHAERRLKRRRIGMFLEVELIRPVPVRHLGFVALKTLLARFPISLMSFGVMRGAERVAPVVADARIRPIRKHDVLVLIVAYPVAAARRPCARLCFVSAQSACRIIRLYNPYPHRPLALLYPMPLLHNA